MGEGLKSPSFLYPNFVKNFTFQVDLLLVKKFTFSNPYYTG